jgi:uncharacterized membrane protein YhhN
MTKLPRPSGGGYTLIVVVLAAVMLAWFLARVGDKDHPGITLFGTSRENRP